MSGKRKLCKNCRYWETGKTETEMGICDKIPANDHSDDNLASADDYEGYSASLSTRAEFGCVLFELKD